ncbi:DUF1987 domain-containing protein [Fulvivirga kasyanovii]|uniref:DUF1987 domain-containing protein n=1 Tax=Fulvivirga kasyanovii TaxID=396812 RepID=A0ABW9RYW6_9BACT|nr:DUF1987 domain-containing protein [Fulvivirga kasyanovii]MTI28235.1 DUF1987 domain-containing protein [Fulvivirga kasyanovii]
MRNLFIEGSRDTYFTPQVELNAKTGICSITGESYLEEPFEFYEKISAWFSEFFNEDDKNLQLDLKLTYFNTSSSRAILEMLRVLKDHKDEGKDVTVNWYYPDPDDEEILMEGEDFMEESGLEINMIEYEMEEEM